MVTKNVSTVPSQTLSSLRIAQSDDKIMKNAFEPVGQSPGYRPSDHTAQIQE